MNPQTPDPRVHASRRLVRRSATFLATVVVAVGVPLVARALDDEAMRVGSAAVDEFELPAAGGATARDSDQFDEGRPTTQSARQRDLSPSTDPALEEAVRVLTDSYEWDERTLRVGALQDLIGVDVDGWYGQSTSQAHRSALEFVGLPTDTVPAPEIAPGPSASQWAALRECEAGGDYSITNPSGKYRGAYQFDRSTWNSIAGRYAPDLVGADPAAAAPADQDAMALALYSERGARPWPHCGRHLR